MTKATCSHPDCARPSHHQQPHPMCVMHAKRYRTHGDWDKVLTRRGPQARTDIEVLAGLIEGETENGCWQVRPEKLTIGGYGAVCYQGKSHWAHRFVYQTLVGPIPDGLQLDHLCRNRACVNPAHLEPVTARENIMRSPIAIAAKNARRTHCVDGHEFTPENTILVGPKGYRACRACRREKSRRRYQAMKARRAA